MNGIVVRAVVLVARSIGSPIETPLRTVSETLPAAPASAGGPSGAVDASDASALVALPLGADCTPGGVPFAAEGDKSPCVASPGGRQARGFGSGTQDRGGSDAELTPA